MFAPDTPTTELEAVNLMLAIIGESPTTTLARAETHADIQAALMLLRKTTRMIQGRGWTFNTDTKWKLIRSLDSTIALPSNAVRIRACVDHPEMLGLRITERKRKVYNLGDQTYLWTKDVYVDILWLLAFEEVPEPVRNYITIAAARLFQKNFEGSPILNQFSQEDEARALADMTDFEVETGNYNFLKDSQAVANLWSER